MFELLRDFLAQGGKVLWVLLAVTAFLWMLILERILFYYWQYPKMANKMAKKWMQRDDRSSWSAKQIRTYWISILKQEIYQNISLINTLVVICPLLGLMGTVTGMIHVFDVMAVAGTGNARLMASGISMATIPTMAGMVASLSALYFGSLLKRKAKSEENDLVQHLSIEKELA
jgi:biopolymer transport protein ExbB